MTNLNNLTIIAGRLTSDPFLFNNKDGSTKCKFTVACENNYKNSNGEKVSQMIPVEAFVKAGVSFEATPYASIHKGDKVRIQASLENNNYTAKDGTKIYEIVVKAQSIQFEESKAVTEQRLAARKAAEANATQPEPVPVPVVQ